LNRYRELKSDLVAAGLALVGTATALSIWWAGSVPTSLTNFIPVSGISSPDLHVAAVVVGLFCVTVGVVLQHFGGRRSVPFVLVAFVLVVLAGLVALRFYSVDLLLAPLLIGGIISLLLVHMNRLWQVDRTLAGRLLKRVTEKRLLKTPAANGRLMSGLKLLQTILPLQEAVVYQVDTLQNLHIAARLKTASDDSQTANRNSLWREGINLCQRAMITGDLVVQPPADGPTSIVAVPLTHDDEPAGTLLLRLKSNFNDDDRPLLAAVGSQFARNLKRESASKQSSLSTLFGFFSYSAARKKLDAAGVLTGLLAEQRCEANALNIIDEGVAIAHLDGTLALTNPALQRFIEIEADDLNQLDIFGLLNKLRTGVFDEPAIAVRRVLQSGVDYESELRFEEKNQTVGLRISLLRETLNVSGDLGEPVGLGVYVRDLTRGKEYEKLKSDMISLMSHELRTPLTSINGFAELLTLDNTIPSQAKEFVTIIANESQRMSRMINTFLAVTQLQRKDKQEVLKIPLRLDEVVRETIATLQPVARKKRIRLVENPSQRIPPVAADKSLITQAVKNLVNNAIKYSPERTTVTVATALEAEVVRVSVADRGFGIPAESKDRVWDKFYRVVRDGQEKDEESTGLGLSFVREVVEQHGGQVDLSSEEGRGSTFSFTLPRL
jgi:signal transduction histidine kinase